MDGGSFVSAMKRPRGRPRKVVPVIAPEPDPRDPGAEAAMTMLERMDAAPREAAVAEVERLRERLRVAHAPVPAVILQLRAQRDVYGPELQRAARLPLSEYSLELGANSLTHPLEMKIAECQGILTGRTYADFSVKSVADQLARLSGQIEQIQLDDVTLIDEICMACARCAEWPSVVVRLMGEIRELIERLAEVRRRRGAGRV
jgi:hypothetical protein